MTIVVLLVLSLWVCGYDWKFRIIPNSICAIIFTIAMWVMLTRGVYPEPQAFLFTTTLAVGLWKLGIWGAGDSKLLLAYFPMIDSQFYIPMIALIGLIGLATALLFLMFLHFNRRCRFRSVPYGIPIALGCFMTSVASF